MNPSNLHRNLHHQLQPQQQPLRPIYFRDPPVLTAEMYVRRPATRPSRQRFSIPTRTAASQPLPARSLESADEPAEPPKVYFYFFIAL